MKEAQDWYNQTGFTEYNGEVYPFRKIIGDYYLLQDYKVSGLNTLMVKKSDCKLIKLP